MEKVSFQPARFGSRARVARGETGQVSCDKGESGRLRSARKGEAGSAMTRSRGLGPNENKMGDGYRERELLGVVAERTLKT